MGDRGSIAIIGGEGREVWLYSHWGGSRLPWTLARAIETGSRGDADYFARHLQARCVADGLSGGDGWVLGFDLIEWVVEGCSDPRLAVDTDPELMRSLLSQMAGQLSYGISSTYTDSEYPLIGVLVSPLGNMPMQVCFAEVPEPGEEIRWVGHTDAEEFVTQCKAVKAVGTNPQPHDLWALARRALSAGVPA